MDPREDLYAVLGIPRGADGAAIKSAYRRLSMELHPDRNPGDATAGNKFARIGQAFEVLGNPETRRQYDEGRLGADGQPRGMPGIPEEVLSAMFGGGMGIPVDPFGGGPGVRVFHMGGHGGPPHGFQSPPEQLEVKDVEESVEVALDKAYSGCTVPITVRRWIVAGQSEREERETLYVPIPRGVDTGEIVRVAEKGNCVDGRRGDVKVFIKVRNDSTFRREGLDLIYKCSLPLRDALSCPPVEIQHLDGRTFRVKGSGGVISPGSKKTLRGFGMIREGQKGNMIIHYEVIFPTKLTQAQVDTIQGVL